MAVGKMVIGGHVRGGVVIPEGTVSLPEGIRVEIAFSPDDLPADLRAEIAAWEQAGEDAWAMIARWEDEAHV